MSSSATLAYSATAFGPMSPANLEAAMSSIILDEAEIETATGCTLTSDITTLHLSVVTRTIIFDIAPATFQANFPLGTDQAAPFRGLYTQALSGGLNTLIAENPVVIA